MYLENCIQRKDTISLTQKIQDIREKTYRPFDRVIETEDASSAKADTPEKPTLITLYGRKNWLSLKERRVDALALRADERRDKLR